MKKVIYAISILSGTIIGVGLFSLPYITSKVGIFVMLGYFLVLGALVIILHLFFGELSLRTPDFKRLPGFAKIYLGKWGQLVAYISTILGLFGALLAYLIIGGQFLESLLSPFLGGNSLFYTFFYFAFGAILIFFGIKAISKIEFWGLILFFIVLVIIFLRGQPFFEMKNLFIAPTLNLNNFFLPYGVILFSLWGASLIPEVEEMLGRRKDLLKKIIPVAILIPILVYIFFIYIILGITGPQTTESALLGLRNFLGDGIVSLGLLFGVLTTFTSFIALGLTLKKVFWYDLKIGKNLAWAITCFFPLAFFLVGIKDFIPVISFVGGIMIGINGILILLMYRACKKISRFSLFYFLTSFLILIFILGVLYEIFYFLKVF
ncbi:MAG TPA: amino acid permease [Candidatus Nealsonbacteria bacterium]|nr:amino acid permease [Candidatus Nealsonbacteria bacterium]